jgi:hypothetical protein
MFARAANALLARSSYTLVPVLDTCSVHRPLPVTPCSMSQAPDEVIFLHALYLIAFVWLFP